MNELKIIHIVGANSSKKHCLDELHRRVGGVRLNFSDNTSLLDANSCDLEHELVLKLRARGRDQKLLLTTGIGILEIKRLSRKAFPGQKVSFILWEVHHDEKLEQDIMKERAFRYLIEGLMVDGKKALSLGLKPDQTFIRQSPLMHAMKLIKGGYEDVQTCLEKISEMESQENLVHVQEAVVCQEAFDRGQRERSIDVIENRLRRA